MSPTEGDRRNIFADYAATPEGRKELDTEDEDEPSETDQDIAPTLQDDVTTPPDSSSTTETTILNNGINTQDNMDTGLMLTETVPMKEKSWADIEYEDDDDDDDDDDGGGKPAAVNHDTENNTATMTTKTAIQNSNTTESIIPLSDTNHKEWDGTIVNGKKTPTTPNKAQSTTTSPLGEQNTTPAILTTKLTHINANSLTPKSKNSKKSQSESTYSRVTTRKNPPISTKTVNTSTQPTQPTHQAVDCSNNIPNPQGTVKYETVRATGDSQFDLQGQIITLFQIFATVEPTVRFRSVINPALEIKTLTDVPKTSAGMKAFFRSSIQESEEDSRFAVLFTLVSSAPSLLELKARQNNLLSNHLAATSAWLKEHSFPSLTTEKIGWISMKPTGISLDGMATTIRLEIQQALGIDNYDIPIFEVALAKVSETTTSKARWTSVLCVQCQTDDVNQLLSLMAQAQPCEEKCGVFVPFTAKRKNPALHNNLLVRHKKYIQGVWTYCVKGLDWALLNAMVKHPVNGYEATVMEHIMFSGTGIRAIDAARVGTDGITTYFTVTSNRRNKEDSYRFLHEELDAIGAMSEEYNGVICVVEAGSSPDSIIMNQLEGRWQPGQAISPARPVANRHQRRRPEQEFDWYGLTEFPLLPEPESILAPRVPGTPASYSTVAARPITVNTTAGPLHAMHPLQGMHPLHLNRNARTHRASRSLVAQTQQRITGNSFGIIPKPPPSKVSVQPPTSSSSPTSPSNMEISPDDMTVEVLSAGDMDSLSPSIAATINSAISALSVCTKRLEDAEATMANQQTLLDEHNKKWLAVETIHEDINKIKKAQEAQAERDKEFLLDQQAALEREHALVTRTEAHQDRMDATITSMEASAKKSQQESETSMKAMLQSFMQQLQVTMCQQVAEKITVPSGVPNKQVNGDTNPAIDGLDVVIPACDSSVSTLTTIANGMSTHHEPPQSNNILEMVLVYTVDESKLKRKVKPKGKALNTQPTDTTKTVQESISPELPTKRQNTQRTPTTQETSITTDAAITTPKDMDCSESPLLATQPQTPKTQDSAISHTTSTTSADDSTPYTQESKAFFAQYGVGSPMTDVHQWRREAAEHNRELQEEAEAEAASAERTAVAFKECRERDGKLRDNLREHTNFETPRSDDDTTTNEEGKLNLEAPTPDDSPHYSASPIHTLHQLNQSGDGDLDAISCTLFAASPASTSELRRSSRIQAQAPLPCSSPIQEATDNATATQSPRTNE